MACEENTALKKNKTRELDEQLTEVQSKVEDFEAKIERVAKPITTCSR